MNNCIISVIIPIYKTNKSELTKCIESVLSTNYESLEIILVDDGSDDIEISDLCNQFCRNNLNVYYYYKDNGGVSSARNYGIKKSHGEYIMFIDADDWIKKETFVNIDKYFKYDLICFSYNKYYSNGKKDKIDFFSQNEKLLNQADYFNMRILGSSCMKLYKKCIITEFFDEQLTNGEDVEFNFRNFRNIKNAIYIKRAIYYYRISQNSSVRTNDLKILDNYSKTIQKMRNELNINDLYQKQAYYSFLGITLLMLMLNTVFTKKNKISYFKKRKTMKRICNQTIYKDLFNQLKYVVLPKTRKIPIFFLKYRLYFLCYLVSIIKHKKNNDC